MTDEASHYAILGVPESATADEIRTAYRRLALEYHPDTLPESVRGRALGRDAERRFRGIAEAYRVLSDGALRKAYDDLRDRNRRAAPGRSLSRGDPHGREAGMWPPTLPSLGRAMRAARLTLLLSVPVLAAGWILSVVLSRGPKPEDLAVVYPAPLGTAVLEISSTVVPAELFLDGRRIGPLPRAVPISPEPHVLDVVRAGCQAVTERVECAPGERRPLRVAVVCPNPASADPFPSGLTDRGACPFDGCVYRLWAVLEETAVRRGPDDREPVLFTVVPGEFVNAETGEVRVSKPGWAKIVETMQPNPRRPEIVLPAGVIVPVYTPLGSDCFRAWTDHGLQRLCLSKEVRMTAPPALEWWVKLQDAEDRTGWARVRDNFGSQRRVR